MIFARVHYKITTIYFYLEHFICSPADKESHYFFPLLFQLTPDAMKVRFLSCDGAYCKPPAAGRHCLQPVPSPPFHDPAPSSDYNQSHPDHLKSELNINN